MLRLGRARPGEPPRAFRHEKHADKEQRRRHRRTRIVLRCAEGMTNTAVAGAERVTMQTVGKWGRRFVQQRLAGLADAARSGAPRTLSDVQVERVIIRTLESKPKYAALYWVWAPCSENIASRNISLRAFRAAGRQGGFFEQDGVGEAVDRRRDETEERKDETDRHAVVTVR